MTEFAVTSCVPPSFLAVPFVYGETAIYFMRAFWSFWNTLPERSIFDTLGLQIPSSIIITFISFVLNLFVWILGHFFIGSFWNTVKSHWPHFCMVSIHVNFNFVHLDSTIVAFYTKFNHTSGCCSTWFHNYCISYKIQPQHKSNATLNFAHVWGGGWKSAVILPFGS